MTGASLTKFYCTGYAKTLIRDHLRNSEHRVRRLRCVWVARHHRLVLNHGQLKQSGRKGDAGKPGLRRLAEADDSFGVADLRSIAGGGHWLAAPGELGA